MMMMMVLLVVFLVGLHVGLLVGLHVVLLVVLHHLKNLAITVRRGIICQNKLLRQWRLV
jgi:hypothetical protein